MKVLLCDMLLFSAICCLTYNITNATCNICQENNAACVNLTSYHLCFGGSKPHTEQLYTCPDGLVCTNLPNICFQRSTLPASCGDTSTCGKCNSKHIFACTSRTTFAFCFGSTTPSDVLGSCPPGKICDNSSAVFCTNKLTPTSIVCDLEEPEVSSALMIYDLFYHTANDYKYNKK